jgi:hypothetical protein
MRRIGGEGSKNLFLVEHGRGLCCCEIRSVGGGRIATISTQLPYAQVEFKVPEEARLVGVLDLEIRSLLRPQQPTIPKELAKRWKLEVLSPEPSQLGPLLRRARLRMGLSFRAASAISREGANLLNDERYFVAPGLCPTMRRSTFHRATFTRWLRSARLIRCICIKYLRLCLSACNR